MKTNVYLKVLCLSGALLLTTAAAALAESVQIRMVRASNEGGRSSVSGDILPVLQDNLPFSKFSQVAARTVNAPSSVPVKLNGYSIRMDGTAALMRVTVSRGRSVLLNSSLALSGKRPVIIGGFQEESGRIIFVINRL